MSPRTSPKLRLIVPSLLLALGSIPLAPLVLSPGRASAGVFADAQTPSATPLTHSDTELETRFLDRLNDVRISVGLAPLASDPMLVDASRSWAGSMRDAGEIAHDRALSRSYPGRWHRLGENVGTGGDVDAIVAAFLASPTHYANVVRPEWDGAGIGVATVGPRIYIVHRFVDHGRARPYNLFLPG